MEKREREGCRDNDEIGYLIVWMRFMYLFRSFLTCSYIVSYCWSLWVYDAVKKRGLISIFGREGGRREGARRTRRGDWWAMTEERRTESAHVISSGA